MGNDGRSPETRSSDGILDGQALHGTRAFLRKLIPFPGSDLVGPLPLSPVALPQLGNVAQVDPVSAAAAVVGEPAVSIVSQAASVLDEEMSKGLLAARSAGSMGPGSGIDAAHPVLRQMHEFVDNLGALWPRLQGGPLMGHLPGHSSSGNAEPLPTVSPRGSVKPGERAAISMTLRNSERQAVRLVPTATDLLGSRGGRIPNSLLEFRPSEIVLEPGEQKDLTISAMVPLEAPSGRYTGLLMVKGLDYLRALIAIDVAGATPASESLPTPPPAHAAGTSGFTPTSIRSASVPRADIPGSDPFGGGGAAPLTPLHPRSGPLPAAARHQAMVQEAIRLAEDGELGKSDAIRLLQIEHRPEDVREVLARFEKELTREAKSKLVLEAFAPLPNGVHNQRYEPIFDRYPITGKTYTIASGTVVLNEVQYYNGEMVQFYGECSNVAQVSKALEGSGYKPVTIRHEDGRQSAIAQFWSHQLTDTSLGPYNAAFVILAAVPDHTPGGQALIAADKNGMSSALAMFDGTFDPAKATFENRVRLFCVRLLDSTQIAIDVGRERMGTDKRPGTIELMRQGSQRSFSVRDGRGNPVAKIDFVISEDPEGGLADVARAAATAGMQGRPYPWGTEYVFPCVARIGSEPVVCWEWRTDVAPRLQRAESGAATFDSRSEEGELLVRWGFTPKVLAHIPNVRGVITGLP
jgi:hypothetical protein